jgi:alanyl-tRNA synthetase
VFRDDDEAFELWKKHVPEKRIVRFGEKENFWAMGDTGPCGPCSELLYDRGAAFGSAKNPHEDTDGERFLEFWNLVFMQYDRSVDGEMRPLPKQSIDTGSGLERIVSLKMGVENVFQTDVLRALIAETEEVSKVRYNPENLDSAPAFHVIADHIRSLSFAIADGAKPSNTDRGYVLRKILRRAVRYGRMLGLQRPFLARVLPRLVAEMGDDFPELKSAEGMIGEILTVEEEAFFRTLQRGGQLLSQVIDRSQRGGLIGGEDAFKLKDTYGMPLEEIVLMAKDEGLKVDTGRFAELEEEAREKSRRAHKSVAQEFDANLFADFAKTHPPCRFVGYDEREACEARVVALLREGAFVDALHEGDEGMIVLDETPFYAEMGGQVGDSGEIGKGATRFMVTDTQAPYPGVVVHQGKVASGAVRKGERLHAAIDGQRRRLIRANHTATHLLHWALQQVAGSHVKQAGSVVDEKRLRFDFSHHKPLTASELRQIEELVNGAIRANRPVQTYELAYDEAQKRGDIKQFFGEKYGAKVRVVDIDASKELCGGTHVEQTGAIGYFKIAKESSIAAGVRRIEAVTGAAAERWVHEEEAALAAAAALLKAAPGQLVEKLEGLLAEKEALAKEAKALRRNALKQLAEECLDKRETVGRVPFVGALLPLQADELSPFAEELLAKMRSGVVAIGVASGEKCQLLVAVSSDLVPAVQAQTLIKEAAPLIQGGGGGKQHLAQAGGKDPAGLPSALEKIRQLLSQAV